MICENDFLWTISHKNTEVVTILCTLTPYLHDVFYLYDYLLTCLNGRIVRILLSLTKDDSCWIAVCRSSESSWCVSLLWFIVVRISERSTDGIMFDRTTFLLFPLLCSPAASGLVILRCAGWGIQIFLIFISIFLFMFY